MTFRRIFVLFVLTCLGASAAMAETLDDYRGEKRPLVVFSPTAIDDRYEQQMQELLRNAIGVRERDLVAVEVIGVEPVRVDALSEPEMSAVDLRDRFEAPEDGFKVVLIGKDGTAKLESAEPVSAETLFETIDAMPMRQREMREEN